MRAVEPAALHQGGSLVVLAKDQPEYEPLPASVSGDGLVMTEWEPSAEELARLQAGARIRIWIHTFGYALQPLNVEAAESADERIRMHGDGSEPPRGVITAGGAAYEAPREPAPDPVPGPVEEKREGNL